MNDINKLDEPRLGLRGGKGLNIESHVVLGTVFVLIIILFIIIYLYNFKQKKLIASYKWLHPLLILVMLISIYFYFYYQDKMRSCSDLMAGAGLYSGKILVTVLIFSMCFISFIIMNLFSLLGQQSLELDKPSR